MLYRYPAGIPWRDFPARFGDFRVVRTRHSRWSDSGFWQRVFEALAQDADNEYVMIDRHHRARPSAQRWCKKGGRISKPSDAAETA